MALTTRTEMTRAIRTAELQGARLMAGGNFGTKTERQDCGRLLVDLADALRRALDKGAVGGGP